MTRPTEAASLDRRRFLAGAAATTAIVVSGSAIIHSGEAWGLEVTSLKPETMKSLIRVARDIYPHDRVSDRFYAIAVKPYDAKAAKDPAFKTLIENGVAKLDQLAKAQHKRPYGDVGWEAERVALLRKIEADPFFAKVRSDLVVSLYNQKEIWPIFGYQGESYSHGGYVSRGFDDITWL